MKSKKKETKFRKVNKPYFMSLVAESVLDEKEKRLLALIKGDKPLNKEEEIMQQQIIALKNSGYAIDIPNSV
ncbi:MAG: hypothetical protein WCJ19_05265 [bacterium]